jgi:hypothetical protein
MDLRVPLSVLPERMKLTLPVLYSSLLVGELSHSVTVPIVTLPSNSISRLLPNRGAALDKEQ